MVYIIWFLLFLNNLFNRLPLMAGSRCEVRALVPKKRLQKTTAHAAVKRLQFKVDHNKIYSSVFKNLANCQANLECMPPFYAFCISRYFWCQTVKTPTVQNYNDVRLRTTITREQWRSTAKPAGIFCTSPAFVKFDACCCSSSRHHTFNTMNDCCWN